MSWRIVALKFLAFVLLAFWLGGFTVYSAVVIPALHEILAPADAGHITQHVTDVLNTLGAATLFAWWALVYCDRRTMTRRGRRTRVILLLATTALLAGLVGLHRLMDDRLSGAGPRGFYPLHRAYLITSTVQWLVNLGLIWVESAREHRDG
ncbi:MAG: hypothetical protein P4L84_13820 [Isosphaeraceae bacterium]|nr:hypothetical protein [Isosphaeraceae bacterium]